MLWAHKDAPSLLVGGETRVPKKHSFRRLMKASSFEKLVAGQMEEMIDVSEQLLRPEGSWSAVKMPAH